MDSINGQYETKANVIQQWLLMRMDNEDGQWWWSMMTLIVREVGNVQLITTTNDDSHWQCPNMGAKDDSHRQRICFCPKWQPVHNEFPTQQQPMMMSTNIANDDRYGLRNWSCPTIMDNTWQRPNAIQPKMMTVIRESIARIDNQNMTTTDDDSQWWWPKITMIVVVGLA